MLFYSGLHLFLTTHQFYLVQTSGLQSPPMHTASLNASSMIANCVKELTRRVAASRNSSSSSGRTWSSPAPKYTMWVFLISSPWYPLCRPPSLAQRLSFSCMLAILITSDRSCLFRKYWPRQDSMLTALPNTLSRPLPLSRTNLHIQNCWSNCVVGRLANDRPRKQYLSAVVEVNSIAEFWPTRVAHRSACRGFCKLIRVSVETFLHESGGKPFMSKDMKSDTGEL